MSNFATFETEIIATDGHYSVPCPEGYKFCYYAHALHLEHKSSGTIVGRIPLPEVQQSPEWWFKKVTVILDHLKAEQPKPAPVRVMLDLETLGEIPGAVITSIGAVKFGGGVLIDSFYRRVDVQSCIDMGLKMDASTVLWWLQQNEVARAELAKPGEHIASVLHNFDVWLATDEAEIWGNGASFDNALLAVAFNLCQRKQPWRPGNNRCYRTIKNLYPEIKIERTGTHHNALEDAKSQALHLMQMLPTL